jgi:hypothetical protein
MARGRTHHRLGNDEGDSEFRGELSQSGRNCGHLAEALDYAQ